MGFISRVKRNFIIFTSVLLVLVIFNSAVALIEGDAWRVGTSSKKLEMMENTDTWNGENIRDVMTSIDEDQLNILADGSITTEKGKVGYNQYINFENKIDGERRGPCSGRIEATLSEGETRTYEICG